LQHLARFTLIFAIIFAVFTISPALLNQPFGPYPLLKYGDVIDLFTPLILIPLYWVLFRVKNDKRPDQREVVAFLVLAALWIEGQSMHLAANAIGHLTGEIADSNAATLTYFLDEVLSHHLWHIGLVGLSALLINRQWKNPFVNERSGLGFEIAAGIIHGFNYFVVIVEGGTAPLGIPFAVLVVIFTLVWGRHKLRQQPILTFFFVTYLVATLCLLAWSMYWGGLPEFSEVGIIG
jgi:hypothetical protein